jgi:periplasmic divalent cation tolerance protein
MTTITLILTTCPDQQVAESIAQHLIEEQLAACVNILGGVLSLYRWQGALCRDQECLLLIKTASERQAELLARLRALHPYEVPEILCLPVDQGHPPYLEWVKQCTMSS